MINILTCKRMILKYINIFVHVFMEKSKSKGYFFIHIFIYLPSTWGKYPLIMTLATNLNLHDHTYS